jgi:RNA polymerase sigma factor (TIGR02999 family)
MRTKVDVTELLVRWRDGDSAALNVLISVIYNELHRLAHRQMAREQPGHALQTTALIHEAYLRLTDVRRMGFANRAHFFAACSEVMRRILIDIARTRSRQRRGGASTHVPLEAAAPIQVCNDSALIALDEALSELATTEPRRARVVELKFYGGLTAEEIALVLGISAETAQRDWKFSKAWLARQIDRKEASIGGSERSS